MSGGRLPFDPSKMAARSRRPATPDSTQEPSEAAGAAARPLTVAQLAQRIGAAITQGVPGRVRVAGEISGLSDRGHFYFSLKDEHALINAVMFQSARRRLNFQPSNGDAVVASGKLDFYDKAGKVSLIVDGLEPIGAGPLEQRYRQLVAELRELGWFDESRKRPMPAFPRALAVITSAKGAALQDVIDTARRRCPAVDLYVIDVRVQGDAAAPEVSAALRAVNAKRHHLGIDAVLITRGGGSIEDLWAFNERTVAEAILASELPVVAAIGHESDTTIAELVADLRAATPTQAAMRLVPDGAALREQTDTTARRLRNELTRRLTTERRHIDQLASRPAVRDPRTPIDTRRRSLAELARRLRSAAERHTAEHDRHLQRLAVRLARVRPASVHARREARLNELARRLDAAPRVRAHNATERTDRAAAALRRVVITALRDERATLESLERELHAVSPQRVLDRGFSVTTRPDGSVLRGVADAQTGDLVVTRLADGRFESTVGRHDAPTHPQPALAPPRRKPARRRGRDDPDQMDLFRPRR